MNSETAYQVTMLMARRLLAEGSITTEDYRELETVFSEKYNPAIGVLISSLSLDFKEQQSDE